MNECEQRSKLSCGPTDMAELRVDMGDIAGEAKGAVNGAKDDVVEGRATAMDGVLTLCAWSASVKTIDGIAGVVREVPDSYGSSARDESENLRPAASGKPKDPEIGIGRSISGVAARAREYGLITIFDTIGVLDSDVMQVTEGDSAIDTDGGCDSYDARSVRF